jgi:tRNA uracil 4-sulfurtransferase
MFIRLTLGFIYHWYWLIFMIIIRYSEIGLKGKNRADFERKLRENVKECLKRNKVPFRKVNRLRGRIVVDTDETCVDLQFIFGIKSYSYAKKLDQDLNTIKEYALRLYSSGTFRVTCQRSDKVIAPSTEIEQEVGAYIVDRTGAKVSLREPDHTIHIDLFSDSAYVYKNKILGLGGLPVGSAGKVLLLIEKESSLAAGIAMLKRGCSVHIWNKAAIDISGINKYVYGYAIREYIGREISIPLVVDDTVDSIQEYNGFVLRPLI